MDSTSWFAFEASGSAKFKSGFWQWANFGAFSSCSSSPGPLVGDLKPRLIQGSQKALGRAFDYGIKARGGLQDAPRSATVLNTQ